MKIPKQTVQTFVVIVILVIAWTAYRWYTTPDYKTITDKFVFGNKDSRVTILEFSDFECPACKAAHPTVRQLQSKYGDRVQFKFVHFPLTQIHKNAELSAEATECANDFGKFYEFADEAFTISPDLTRDNLVSIAKKLSIPDDQFAACLDSGWKRQFILLDVRDGITRGLKGTPTFFINDKEVPDRSFNAFSNVIDAELVKVGE